MQQSIMKSMPPTDLSTPFTSIKITQLRTSKMQQMRNLDIQRPQEIREAGYTGEVHPVILSMVDWQRSLSKRLLGIGPLSKSLMFLHYITHISKLPA